MEEMFVDPFIQSITEIIEQFGIRTVKVGKTSIYEEMVINMDVTAFIGIVGSMTGNVAYSFSHDTAKNLASTMMMGMPVIEFDSMARSAIAELANMFTGSAVTKLSGLHPGMDITPPSVVSGDNILFMLGSVKTASVVMEMDIGKMEVHIGLEL